MCITSFDLLFLACILVMVSYFTLQATADFVFLESLCSTSIVIE